MNTSDVLARTKARVAAGLTPKQLSALDYPITLCITPALERYAKVASRSAMHKLPRKDFSATPAAGVYDLTAASGILPETVSDIRLASGTTPLIRARTYNDLLATHPADVIVYYVQTDANGAALRFSDTSNSITGFASAVKISANYVPTLAQLSSQDENDFIDCVIELFNQRNKILVPEGEQEVSV
jgi:hypothetical protein